jgi:hypothetical protein
MDFNPVTDQIRLVNNNDQNLRIDPNNGTLAGTDTNLDNTAMTEEVVAAAYDHNFAGATVTTLFDLDYINDLLVRQGGVNGIPSANNGVLTTIGGFGLTTANKNTNFDIDANGTGVVTATPMSDLIPRLWTINLNTGALTLVSSLGTELGGFAILPTPAPPAPTPPATGTPAAPTAPTPARKRCKKKGKRASAARKKCHKRRRS